MNRRVDRWVKSELRERMKKNAQSRRETVNGKTQQQSDHKKVGVKLRCWQKMLMGL